MLRAIQCWTLLLSPALRRTTRHITRPATTRFRTSLRHTTPSRARRTTRPTRPAMTEGPLMIAEVMTADRFQAIDRNEEHKQIWLYQIGSFATAHVQIHTETF